MSSEQDAVETCGVSHREVYPAERKECWERKDITHTIGLTRSPSFFSQASIRSDQASFLLLLLFLFSGCKRVG